MKKLLFAVALIATLSLVAAAQNTDARSHMRNYGIKSRPSPNIQLSTPHACTVNASHPCEYYGGDFNTSDGNANGYANENTLLVANTWTYAEMKAPITAAVTIHATFNNVQPVSYDNIDPKQGVWDWRTGVSEGNGGTDTGTGTANAQFTATGRICYGVYPEYELLVASTVAVEPGDNFFTVQPQCTNSGNTNCSSAQYFTSTTDGTMDAIRGTLTVKPVSGNNAAASAKPKGCRGGKVRAP